MLPQSSMSVTHLFRARKVMAAIGPFNVGQSSLCSDVLVGEGSQHDAVGMCVGVLNMLGWLATHARSGHQSFAVLAKCPAADTQRTHAIVISPVAILCPRFGRHGPANKPVFTYFQKD
jgi:hypothetical protein